MRAAIVGEVAYLGTGSGEVVALCLSSGKPRWRTRFARGAAVRSSPAVSGGRLYVGDTEGTFHALSIEDGKEAFSFRTDGEIVSSPNLAGERVLAVWGDLTDEGFRKAFWIPGIDQYTSVWHGEKVLVALQYAPWSGFEPQFNGGIPVGKFSPGTGFKEYVIQQAAEALLFRNFNDPSLRLQEKSLAVNLVIEVLKRIRKVDNDIAVVIFTGFPNLESAVASMKLDAVDYIKKPFNVDEFREVLARVMKKKGLARTPEEQLHKIIGDTIRTLRKERELTLKQMSRRTGLSISLLSQIERAESSPSISSLYKIAVALESRIQELFGAN